MATEFKLPELGENISSADVVRIMVHEGDVIAANDGVVELETEKAVVELPCPLAGRVGKIHVAKGQTITVGQPILTIETEAERGEKPKPAGGDAPPVSQPETQPFAAKALPSATSAPFGPPPIVQPSATATATAPLAAGPETRRLARELGVELSLVRGTGKRGRITPEDVRVAAVATRPEAATQQPVAATTPAIAPPQIGSIPVAPQAGGAQAAGPESAIPLGESGQDAFGSIRRERMSRIRRTIAAQMAKSASTIPHVTNFDDADVTELEHIRKNVPPDYLGAAVKLTALAFVVKAVALALRQHPVLNASLNEEEQEIVYKQYVNVGIAVDTPRGLVVPVLRNVEQMGVLSIARELTVLASRARAAEFTLDELRGGTFTISNLGAVGGAYSTPIINHPEVAILLLGRSRWLPRMWENKVEGRLLMPLSLSYDHRVVDGASAGRFLNSVIDYLQTPGKLLLAD